MIVNAFDISVLDSLTAHIAVLNAQGVIVAVNKAWQQFGTENGLPEPSHGILGTNYLDTCKNAVNQSYGDEANAAQLGIAAVLAGEQETFHLEYPCHSPNQQRWFSMNVSPLQSLQGGVVVSHENITERKLAEIALRDSESRFSAIIEASPVPMALNDTQGNITYLNQTFIQTLGYTLADIPTLADWWSCAYPDPSYQHWVIDNWYNKLAEAIGSNKPFEPLEVNIVCKDASVRTFMIAASALKDNFSDTHLVTLYDITERKQAEGQLHASKNKLEAALAGMNDAVYISDTEGRFIEFNESFAIFHKFRNKAESPNILDEYPNFIDAYSTSGEFLPLEKRPVPCALRGEIATNVELTLRRKDTNETWIGSFNYAPIRNDNGVIVGSVVTARDITERKQAERILREKERLLADSQAIAHIGSWAMDISTGTINWSEETFRLYGLSPLTDKPPTIEQFFELLHPDDRLRMKDWLEAISSGNQPAALEYRTHPVNGNSRYLLRTGVLETDSNGKPLRIIGTVQDITERKKTEETIYDLAYYDPLTHLPNRSLMHDRLKQALISRKLKSRYGAVLFIDLNDFKTLNDTKGHDIGDLLLIKVSTHLQAAVHEDDTVARTGGNEFVVLLDALDTTTELAAVQAEAIAKRILAAIGVSLDLRGYEYRCSASIGIALFHSHEISVDDLLKKADMAVHQAKQVGKNTICFFDPAVQTALEFRVQLEVWMRKALNEEYKLYYQIQIDDKGKATGAEALIRWHHPEQGIISPMDFIPLAEQTGLILQIGQWVLKTACMQLKAWQHNQDTQHLVLAVNVSAKQFSQSGFVKQVLTVLEQTGANPDKLKLELTESMLLDNVEDIIIKMNALKVIGVKFSLDDFGTGFSSLSYLKRLPFNQLKIDQSFVRDALTDPNDATIICTIIALGQSLGMEIIAEGVETAAQQNFLVTHGCNHYQGYLFSKPLPLKEFEQLLRNNA